MNWILYSVIMFLGSIAYYLIVKHVQKLGIDKYVYMAVNSIIPLFLFLGIALVNKDSLMMSTNGFILAFIAAIILNYFGSYFGFLGIKFAPNAGYSVIIQKSYTLYTSVFAIFLFGSELPWQKILAIVTIIIFTGVIVIDKTDKTFKIGKWVWYSLAAFFLFGLTTIFSKYISLWGESPAVYLFWVMLGTTVVSWVQYYINRDKVNVKINFKLVLWLIIMSTSVTIFYWGKIQSSISAPNVGYTGSINAASNAVLVIISALLYKQKLKLSKIFSIFMVVIGLAVLVW